MDITDRQRDLLIECIETQQCAMLETYKKFKNIKDMQRKLLDELMELEELYNLLNVGEH